MLAVKYQNADTLEWQLQSACRKADPQLFYMDENMRGKDKEDRIKAAKAVCATCPVRAACLNYALDNREVYGVWGGTSEEERARMRGQSRVWR